jgi:hypothetical protein
MSSVHLDSAAFQGPGHTAGANGQYLDMLKGMQQAMMPTYDGRAGVYVTNQGTFFGGGAQGGPPRPPMGTISVTDAVNGFARIWSAIVRVFDLRNMVTLAVLRPKELGDTFVFEVETIQMLPSVALRYVDTVPLPTSKTFRRKTRFTLQRFAVNYDITREDAQMSAGATKTAHMRWQERTNAMLRNIENTNRSMLITHIPSAVQLSIDLRRQTPGNLSARELHRLEAEQRARFLLVGNRLDDSLKWIAREVVRIASEKYENTCPNGVTLLVPDRMITAPGQYVPTEAEQTLVEIDLPQVVSAITRYRAPEPRVLPRVKLTGLYDKTVNARVIRYHPIREEGKNKCPWQSQAEIGTVAFMMTRDTTYRVPGERDIDMLCSDTPDKTRTVAFADVYAHCGIWVPGGRCGLTLPQVATGSDNAVMFPKARNVLGGSFNGSCALYSADVETAQRVADYVVRNAHSALEQKLGSQAAATLGGPVNAPLVKMVARLFMLPEAAGQVAGGYANLTIGTIAKAVFELEPVNAFIRKLRGTNDQGLGSWSELDQVILLVWSCASMCAASERYRAAQGFYAPLDFGVCGSWTFTTAPVVAVFGELGFWGTSMAWEDNMQSVENAFFASRLSYATGAIITNPEAAMKLDHAWGELADVRGTSLMQPSEYSPRAAVNKKQGHLFGTLLGVCGLAVPTLNSELGIIPCFNPDARDDSSCTGMIEAVQRAVAHPSWYQALKDANYQYAPHAAEFWFMQDWYRERVYDSVKQRVVPGTVHAGRVMPGPERLHRYMRSN